MVATAHAEDATAHIANARAYIEAAIYRMAEVSYHIEVSPIESINGHTEAVTSHIVTTSAQIHHFEPVCPSHTKKRSRF